MPVTDTAKRIVKKKGEVQLKEKLTKQERESCVGIFARMSDLVWIYEQPMCPQKKEERVNSDFSTNNWSDLYTRVSIFAGEKQIEIIEPAQIGYTVFFKTQLFVDTREQFSRLVADKARASRKPQVSSDISDEEIKDILSDVYSED